MANVNRVKIGPEQTNLKHAASFVEWTVSKITQEVENCIESEIAMKNCQISGKIEKSLDNPDKIGKFCAKFGLKHE